MTDIKGKVAVVTGGTSGIGHAIAEELARGGARVFVTGLGSSEQINEALGRIEAGAEVAPQHDPADMRDAGQVRDMIGRVAKAAGAVDILVNNAGVQHTARVEEFPQERWDEIIAVNLSAAFHASAAALPGMQGARLRPDHQHLLRARAGRVGREGCLRVGQARNHRPHQGDRAGERRGQHHLQRHLSGMGADAAHPGADREAGGEDGRRHGGGGRDLLQEKEPSLRFTRIEDIASAVMFMLSPAGDNMTGSSLTLDGGWTVR